MSFPVGWGVTREIGNTLGSFWDDNRDFIQPTEFLFTKSGRIMTSTYSSSPIGRTDPAETLTLLKFLANRKK